MKRNTCFFNKIYGHHGTKILAYCVTMETSSIRCTRNKQLLESWPRCRYVGNSAVPLSLTITVMQNVFDQSAELWTEKFKYGMMSCSWVPLLRRLFKVVEDELNVGHPRCMSNRWKCVESLEPPLGRIKSCRMSWNEFLNFWKMRSDFRFNFDDWGEIPFLFLTVNFEGYREWIEDVECFECCQRLWKVVRKWFGSHSKVRPTKFTIDQFRWPSKHFRSPSITFDNPRSLSIKKSIEDIWMLSKVVESNCKVIKRVIEGRRGLSNVLPGPFAAGHLRGTLDGWSKAVDC